MRLSYFIQQHPTSPISIAVLILFVPLSLTWRSYIPVYTACATRCVRLGRQSHVHLRMRLPCWCVTTNTCFSLLLIALDTHTRHKRSASVSRESLSGGLVIRQLCREHQCRTTTLRLDLRLTALTCRTPSRNAPLDASYSRILVVCVVYCILGKSSS